MTREEMIAKAAEILTTEAGPNARVILFGSHARGNARAGSDLDFLVIEPEVEGRHREMVRLRRSLRGIDAPIDVLVYSEEEARAWGRVPGTAIHDALQEGRSSLVSEPGDIPAGLLESAREDAAAARLIADAEVPDRMVGFHAQQAVEMFLKAVPRCEVSATSGLTTSSALLRSSRIVGSSRLRTSTSLHSSSPWAVERRYRDLFDPEPLDRQWALELVGHTEDWAARAFASDG